MANVIRTVLVILHEHALCPPDIKHGNYMYDPNLQYFISDSYQIYYMYVSCRIMCTIGWGSLPVWLSLMVHLDFMFSSFVYDYLAGIKLTTQLL